MSRSTIDVRGRAKGSVPTMSNSNPTNAQGLILKSRPQLRPAGLVIVFCLAAIVRVRLLDASRMISERQYRSALMTRAYYYARTDSVPEWKKQVALASQRRAGILEPPIMELLVANIYRLVGGEHLWIARLLSSAFWIIGGIWFYKIAERISSPVAALCATTYYLLAPLAVVASISFLPDMLMVMLFLSGLSALLRYRERPSRLGLVLAAALSGLSILVKPLCLFAVLGASIALAVHSRSARQGFTLRDLAVFASISLLPSALYYSYGIFIAGFLTYQAQFSIAPTLLLTRDYWKNWMLTATRAVGLLPLIAALIGLPMAHKGLPRALLAGLWAGYVVFCLVFTYHIRFADYYHLQLIIIVALSFASLIALIAGHLRQLPNRWVWWLPLCAALLLLLVFGWREVRERLADYRAYESKQTAREIGEIVNHSSLVVYLAPYYGTPLEYYGELSGVYWPRRTALKVEPAGKQELSIAERLEALDLVPEYFVITDFVEYDNHHSDLKQFLNSHCSLEAETEQYIIYGACKE